MSLSESVVVRLRSDGQRGLFVVSPVQKDEILIIYDGPIIDRATRHSIQIDEHAHIDGTPESNAWLNHSCAPNAYVDWNGVFLRALRDLHAGEELTCNYLTTDWDLHQKFRCTCGAPNCLGELKGFKYLSPEQQRSLEPFVPQFMRRRSMTFTNCYEDAIRADSYARLEFANTYHLAYRDLPDIIRTHVKGTKAIDFGCGTGRSTRFVQQLGFDVVGVDTAPEMIAKAKELSPGGDYRLVKDDDLSEFEAGTYDLALSVFTFDNVAGFGTKVRLLGDLRALLNDGGTMINVVSSPEIYTHEWSSFSTKDYPENRFARSGDVVRIITTDFPDRRPAEDILCTDATYRQIYARAGLTPVAMYKPLARGDEQYKWINETKIAPWVIYVLTR